jgi:hypothetical protein
MTKVPIVFVSAAVVALVAACGAGSPEAQSPVAATSSIGSGTSSTTGDGSDAGSDAGASSSSESDAAPPTEDSGGTEAARPAQGAPSLDLAGLPIGVNADGGCLTVRLLSSASEVPPGMGLRITGVSFTPRAIEVGSAGCTGHDAACLGLTLTESSTDECVVPIESAGGAAPGELVSVSIQASIDCPPGQTPACLAYKEKVREDFREQEPVTVGVPDSASGSTDSSDAPSDSSDSSSDASSDSSAGGQSPPDSSSSGG